MPCLGYFASAGEAALCYARHVGAERAAAEAAEARGEGPRPLTPDEARAKAAAEGLELVPSSSNKTGFKGVSKRGNRYISQSDKRRYLGIFETAEEAALYYARHVGAEQAQWKSPNGLQLMPQDSSAALEGGSPSAAATVVALMPAVRAKSFECLPAHTPAPAHAPALSSTLTPTPTLTPASAAVGKDLPLNHFVWNDAGRNFLPPLAVQHHYVESMQTTVVGMSATLPPASDHSIHAHFSNAPAATNKGTKAKKAPKEKLKWAPPRHL